MRIRFGYVAIALGITQGSPNKTVTVKSLEKIRDTNDRFFRLHTILKENLETTLRILRYNIAHQIHLYRLTSKTVPLATHDTYRGWDYISDFKNYWEAIGLIIRQQEMRISAHPDHFTILNSPKPEVLAASILDLNYHSAILEAMKLPAEPQLVIHIGGLYKNKELSLRKFKTEFTGLSENLRSRLILENDDKSYSASDVLALCQELGCPMVLDIHHHACLPSASLSSIWPEIVKTWNGGIPKIHVSSPKSKKDFRSHADYIDPINFLDFLKSAKEYNYDLDVMVEAKAKDLAMFRLIEDLSEIEGTKRIDLTTIEI